MAGNEIVFKETHSHEYGTLETTALYWPDQKMACVNTRVQSKYADGWRNFPSMHITTSSDTAKTIAASVHNGHVAKIELRLLEASDGLYNY